MSVSSNNSEAETSQPTEAADVPNEDKTDDQQQVDSANSPVSGDQQQQQKEDVVPVHKTPEKAEKSSPDSTQDKPASAPVACLYSEMDWLSCEQAAVASVEEVQTILKVNASRGLDVTEAARRRTLHGLNEVGFKKPDPLWKKYIDQFNNPFIFLLLASAAISIFMQQIDDAVSITVAIIIVVTVGFVQEYRSEKTLERMGALLPPTCHVIRSGNVETVFAKYLVPGDVVQLNVGDRIPADMRFIEAIDLSVDESSFTGENEQKHKTENVVEPVPKMSCMEMGNIGFTGTLVIGGKGTGIVVCTGEKSQFGEVFKLMQSEDPPRTPLQKSMDILGKQLSVYSLGVIGVLMIAGCLKGKSVLEMFEVGVSLAVAAIPEGLPIVVTVTLAFGVMRMARRNAIVKRLPTVEALGCTDWICSDKTGTLTTGEMTVTALLSADKILNSDAEDRELFRLKELSEFTHESKELERLLEVAFLCNNVIDHGEDIKDLKGNPSEKALYAVAKATGITSRKHEFQRVEEIPFSPERKTMSVKCKHRASGEEEWFQKGALERISCKYVRNSLGQLEEWSQEHLQNAHRVMELFGVQGQRVIALARGESENELEFVGLAALSDPPRPGVKESIEILQNSGVNVTMITGDAPSTSMAISRRLGLVSDGKTQFGGEDLDRMSDPELESVVEKAFCFYRVSPRHKVRIVKALQACDHVVAMTGDGVNDGVAIKKADVGISMGVSGTDVCKEAADMILCDDDFSTILHAVEEGKGIFYNIRNFVRFQLSTSIAALMLISMSTLLNTPNPLNPMQILWINVIMDGPPAQSLGLEPVDNDILKRPPRSKKEQILSRGLLVNVLISAGIIIAGTLWIFKEMMDDDKITPRDTTMTFTCFVFFDMFNALSSRSQERLIVEIGFFSNKMFCLAVLLSILGQLAVIYLKPLQYVFQTEALSLEDLLLLFGLASSVFVVCELKKFLERFSISEFSRVCLKRRSASASSRGTSAASTPWPIGKSNTV